MYRPHKDKKKILYRIKKEVNNFLKKIYWKPVTIILYFFRTAKAFRQVVLSGYVGPEAITPKSSPGTSLIAKVITFAGKA